MKKIFVSMIIIIELLCFCNTTIAMAMSNTDTTEVQQEVTNSVDNSTLLQDEQDKLEETIMAEEKIQEEKETLEIPKQEKNVLEETTDIKKEEQESSNSNETVENTTKEGEQEENQANENVSDVIEEKEELNNNETTTNDTPNNTDDDKVVTLTFPYNNTTYSVDLSSKKLGVNLDEYAYYFVYKYGRELVLYYSKERLKAMNKINSEEYQMMYGQQAIEIKIGENGTLQQGISGYTYCRFRINTLIASNQNIYYEVSYETTKIFDRNCGYEYDITKEKTEIVEEKVKVTKTINVYEKPALNYDIKATVQQGMVLKRIKEAVNKVNGKVWDKVELSDGTEAYIISENAEVVTDVKEISFKSNDKIYRIYLSQSSFKVDLNDYEYYFVYKYGRELVLYYSKERLKAINKVNSEEYQIEYGQQAIQIRIGESGTLNQGITGDKYSRFYTERLIVSNQDICYGNQVIFQEFYGYSNESIKAVKAYCRYNKINNFTGNINSTYENDIILAVKEYQKLNDLNQNGHIDVDTFEKMGLNNTNEYNTYLKIGDNYNQYNNPYGPTPYKVKDSSMYFELNREGAEFERQAYYDFQESKYNTMSDDERIFKKDKMDKEIASLIEIRLATADLYPHASSGVAKFLSNEGGTLHVQNVEKLFNVGNSGEYRRKYLSEARNAIETMLTVEKATSFSMVQASSVVLPKTAIDWYGLYGTYLFSVEGRCNKIGNTYVATGFCYARDYYDFDKVDELMYIVGTINDLSKEDTKIDYTDLVTTIFADLHYAGKARFFYVEGKDDGFQYTWYVKEGEE